jgi:hypothetical protein
MMVFQKDEYLRRVRLAESALVRAGLDALIAYAVRNDPGSVVYLTGYEPSLGLHDVAFFVMVPGQSPTCTLFTNAFWDNPGSRTWVDEIVITSDFGTSLADFLPESANESESRDIAFSRLLYIPPCSLLDPRYGSRMQPNC